MNRKPRDRRNRKKKFDPYLFGAERGPLGATPKGQMHKDLREMDQENMKAYEEYQRAPRFLEKGGAARSSDGFDILLLNPNKIVTKEEPFVLKNMVTPSGKIVDVSKNKPVKMKYGGAVMKGRGGSYKGCK